MKPEPCSMALLVEAKRDGRLGDRELASVDRHLATCAACAELAHDLRQIRALLHAPTPEPSPLEVRRGRFKLLRDAALLRASSPARRHPAMVFALGVAAAGAIGFTLHRHATESGSVVAQDPSASVSAPLRTVTTVTPEDQARFDRTSADGTEVVTLSDGAVSLSVRHLQKGERFLVRTGDAEVEVRGTLFRVEAKDDHIRNVAVREGRVEVRFHGGTFDVKADERWDRPADAPLLLSTATAQPHVEPASPFPTTSTTSKLRPSRPLPLPSAKPSAEDPSMGFEEGMEMMAHGDYGAAAKRLDAFSRANPRDDRAEDAAFLVILALQRAGRATAAVEAARRYLATYPSGYRRAQAKAIAEAP